MIKQCKSCKYYIPKDAISCLHCGADQRKFWGPAWKIISTILSIATFLMAISIVWQTIIIKESFEMENRPYLYIDISPLAFSHREKQIGSEKEYDNLYVGAELKYKNVGNLPACNIKSEIHFYSDMDKGDNFERLKNWYIEEFGYFPAPTTIFPHQEGQKIPCRVDCSDSTKDYLFTIRVIYTGEDPKKEYWYATDVRYSLEKGYFKQTQKLIRQGDEIVSVPGDKEYAAYLIEAKSDYDRNGKARMPKAMIRPYK
jgi:hypothetical protein